MPTAIAQVTVGPHEIPISAFELDAVPYGLPGDWMHHRSIRIRDCEACVQKPSRQTRDFTSRHARDLHPEKLSCLACGFVLGRNAWVVEGLSFVPEER